ncbi:MAG: DUF2284 domain-containing protein [Spirochaetaceae bacterium]|jgi:predicted metal-binding protein|nr:DUF2284 domain-containing protein [Spirochaetaceae bacterium]
MSYQLADALAKECGFSHWGPLDPATIVLLPEVRDMCKANKCGAYDTSWACPPALGTLDECRERIKPYSQGILLQTTALLEDEFDGEAMQKAYEDNNERTLAFLKQFKAKVPEAMVFGGGACKKCARCSYPNAPCRFPELFTPSLEAYGIVVSDICKANSLPYYYGPLTLTYTAAALF